MNSFFQRKKVWIVFPVFLCAILILVSSVSAQTTATVTVMGVVKAHPPIAAFIGIPLSGTAPLLVTFTDKSTQSPNSWKWEYRNGPVGWTKFSASQNPSYIFPAGTYDIRLTVTNTAGSDYLTKTDYLTVALPLKKPVAHFSVSPDMGKAPLRVSFKDDSLNNPTSYYWKFGDGSSSVLKNPPMHEYQQAGFYLIRLTVANSAGSDSAEKFVVVTPRFWWFNWDWR